MALSSEVTGYYSGATGISSLSVDMQDAFDGSSPEPGGTAQLRDEFDSNSEAGMTTQLMDYQGSTVH